MRAQFHVFRLLLLTAVASGVPVGGCVAVDAQTAAVHRPWAQPLALAGIDDARLNLHRVTPNFYRSAQPDQREFGELVHQYGVRTVISLRAFHSDAPLLAGLPVRSYDVPMHTWHIEDEDVVFALRELRRAARRGPALVHCEHGADRTGLITALYRIVYQGWDKEAAIDEMLGGHFGFHDVWINIPDYIRHADIKELRRRVNEG